MRFILLSFFILFIGCGSPTKSETKYVDNTKIEDSEPEHNSSTDLDNDKNKAEKRYESVESIRELIRDNGSELTYICVGDSTRSIADSPKLFERLSAALNRHGVSSYLVAKSGYKLSEFVSDNGGETNYKKVIDNVSNNGKNTIVDISLSINDLWDFAKQEDEKESIQNRLKSDLIKAMNLIKEKKPKTIFIFTSPNPMQIWDEGTEIYMEVYRELSSELKIPFIDYYDNVFVYFDSAQKRKMYRNGGTDKIHYSDFGQLEMADYIIEQLGL